MFSFSICVSLWLYIYSAWLDNNDALSSNKILTDEIVVLIECVLCESCEDSF